MKFCQEKKKEDMPVKKKKKKIVATANVKPSASLVCQSARCCL